MAEAEVVQGFPPSSVVLRSPLLCDTLGKAEREVAAALIVRTCAVHGDRWRPVELDQLLEVFRADAAAIRSPWGGLAEAISRGLLFPDFAGLLAHGFAVARGPEGGPAILELTPLALERIGKWSVVGWWSEPDLEALPEEELGVAAHG